MREKRIFDLIISLAVIREIVVTFSLAALVLFVVVWGIGVEYVYVLRDFLSAFSGVAFFLVKFFVFILVFIFLVRFVCWLCKNEDSIMILPFDVATGEDGYCGKAISDLLTAELLRIKHIREEIKKIKPTPTLPSLVPKSKAPTSFEKKASFFPKLVPSRDNLPYKVAGAAVQVGPFWVFIGPLLAALKQLWPMGDTEQVITGSLQKYGPMICLVAHLEHREIRAWEVQRKIRPQDKCQEEQIPLMVGDLAFKIAKDLSNEQDGQARTWQGFKHIIEAWNAYYRFTLTEDEMELEHAWESCLMAAKAEVGYEEPFDLLLELGITYLNNNKYGVAEKLFGQAVDIKPDSNFFFGRGFAFANLKQFEEALKCFEKAIELDRRHESAWYGKGITLRDLGRYKDALDCFEKVIELDKENVQLALLNKGYILSYFSKYKPALDSYSKAIELDSEDILALYGKGFTLEKLNMWDEAISYYQKIVKLDPNFTVARIELARLYRKSDHEYESAEQCKRACNLIEKESEYNRACFEAVCGSPDAAIDLLRTALEKKEQTADWARRDPDFESIRDDPRFKALLNEFSASEDKGPE